MNKSDSIEMEVIKASKSAVEHKIATYRNEVVDLNRTLNPPPTRMHQLEKCIIRHNQTLDVINLMIKDIERRYAQVLNVVMQENNTGPGYSCGKTKFKQRNIQCMTEDVRDYVVNALRCCSVVTSVWCSTTTAPFEIGYTFPTEKDSFVQGIVLQASLASAGTAPTQY